MSVADALGLQNGLMNTSPICLESVEPFLPVPLCKASTAKAHYTRLKNQGYLAVFGHRFKDSPDPLKALLDELVFRGV